jgi:hypothetical protein
MRAHVQQLLLLVVASSSSPGASNEAGLDDDICFLQLQLPRFSSSDMAGSSGAKVKTPPNMGSIGASASTVMDWLPLSLASLGIQGSASTLRSHLGVAATNFPSLEVVIAICIVFGIVSLAAFVLANKKNRERTGEISRHGPTDRNIEEDGENAGLAKPTSETVAAHPYKMELQNIFKQHSPEKLQDIDNLLQQYKGHESDLYKRVCDRYGIMPIPSLLPKEKDAPKLEESDGVIMLEKTAGNKWGLTHGEGAGQAYGNGTVIEGDDDGRGWVQIRAQAPFQIGERVECRDNGGKWGAGYIASLQPLRVTLRGDPNCLSFKWDDVRHIEARSVPVKVPAPESHERKSARRCTDWGC